MSKRMQRPSTALQSVIGWREWVNLPDLQVHGLKAKVDTGARSSSLHAYDIEEFQRGSVAWVRFSILPLQHTSANRILAESPLIEYRRVRSSSGHQSLRPVIRTRMQLANCLCPIELTLSSRDEMGFRMLIGREALLHRFFVDASSSYIGGKTTSSA